MTIAKRLLLLVLVVALSTPVIGCGVGSTQADQDRMVRHVADYDARMLVDDFATFTLLHRPFRGSRYVVE